MIIGRSFKFLTKPLVSYNKFLDKVKKRIDVGFNIVK